MRLNPTPLLLACLIGLAACAADAPDSGPKQMSDDDDSAPGSTRRTDAGKGSTDAGRRNADAGKSSASDAGVRDAAAKPASADASSTATDAGTTSAKTDAGQGSTAKDAGSVASGESGRLVGMTAAHNAVRAMVKATPPLPDMVWDPEVAAYAQQWSDKLASTKATCDQPSHRSGSDLMAKGYGENLATFSGVGAPPNTMPQQALGGWAAEVACWTYGTLSGLGVSGTEMCDEACYTKMHSDGCGHYTQVVWKTSTKLGCGVSTCTNSRGYQTDIWICNYSPGGNYVGQTPY